MAIGSLVTSISLAVIVCILILFQFKSKILLSEDYTYCRQINQANVTCAHLVSKQMSIDRPVELLPGGASCQCRLEFKLDEDLATDRVHIYYGLKNFYQNYRFLAQSQDQRQLSGDLTPSRWPNRYCLDKATNKSIAPCGQLANVMFDDNYRLSYGNESLHLDRFNIAPENSRLLFKNPKDLGKLAEFSKPARWRKPIQELQDDGPSDGRNLGFENGPFIVWMMISAFDSFYKLYAIVRPADGRLRKGTYSVLVDYNYGVAGGGDENNKTSSSEARKVIQIETLNETGVKNTGLLVSLSVIALAYLLVFVVLSCGLWRAGGRRRRHLQEGGRANSGRRHEPDDWPEESGAS